MLLFLPERLQRACADVAAVICVFKVDVPDARSLLSEAKQLPGVEHLERVRILNRYDVEHITPELFDYAVKTVFSEPQVDLVTREADTDGASVFAVEYLPGQFDQRADSAAQCIQIISQGERPDVRTARVYLLYGALDVYKRQAESSVRTLWAI